MAELFLELVKMSLVGSLFAVAVMAVRLVFGKAPKWIFVALWGVVALRLILPFSVESKVSLVPDSLVSGQIAADIRDAYVGPVDIIREEDPAYPDALAAGGLPVQSSQGNYIVTQKDSLETPKTMGQTVLPVLGWVWLAGVALMTAYTVGSYLLLKRKMAVATLLEENIWQCEEADMPFVLGVFRPKIYLPYWITGEDLGYVIAHEQAHIARRDHWWKPLGFFLLSLHWFNPVIWVAYILLCRDIEAACDEKVIGPMEKEGVRAYSKALLNCSVHRRRIAACPLAFGETGVKERIKRVMHYKKPAFWIILIAIVIGAVIVVCFCTDPLKKEQNPAPSETGTTEETRTENKENTNQTDGSTTETTDNTTENKDNTGTVTTPWWEQVKTVLSGPVTQYVQVDNSKTVTYRQKYHKEDTVIPVSLPKFLPFSADAIACQAGLETDLEWELTQIAEDVTHKSSNSVFYINFDAFLNGDILSVVIKTQYAAGDNVSYTVYNFDITTGKRLSKEALIEKLQITNFDERLTQTAKNGFETKYGPVGNTDGFKTQQLNATMYPENLDGTKLYIGQDGKLMTVIYIYAIAGAAGYYELVPFA